MYTSIVNYFRIVHNVSIVKYLDLPIKKTKKKQKNKKKESESPI